MIRPGTGRDSTDMGRIYCLAWQRAYAGIVPDEFLESLSPENCAPPPAVIAPDGCRVYEDAGRVVGLVNFGPDRDCGAGGLAEVRTIYVLPEYWRRGIGRALMRAAAGAVRDAGYPGFFLWVLTENARARRFYESMGLRFTGEVREIEIAGKPLSESRYILNFESRAGCSNGALQASIAGSTPVPQTADDQTH